ncbi:MAG: DUF1822 family protein [Richelia sp. CSU_2_1]|nr:DUF1822 family protein [Richelia sp. CSU_2_1]
MNNTTVDFVLTIPLGREAHLTAEKLSQQQSDPKTAKQVYLNVLAVHAVNFYFQCLEIETDLTASEIGNPVVQKFMDVADLDIKDIGKLECRWVGPDEDFVAIPAEVRSDRIGYVAVEISESLTAAKLLGFVKQTDRAKISVSELKPIENLLEYLDELKPVNLDRWLHNVFDIGWHTVEQLFESKPELQFAFRSPKALEVSDLAGDRTPIKLGKVVHLGQENLVTLMVGLTPTDQQDIDISVELMPAGNQTDLPESLQLMVLDDRGETLVQARANKTDNLLFQLSAEPGENFSVKMVLGDISKTEKFLT